MLPGNETALSDDAQYTGKDTPNITQENILPGESFCEQKCTSMSPEFAKEERVVDQTKNVINADKLSINGCRNIGFVEM